MKNYLFRKFFFGDYKKLFSFGKFVFSGAGWDFFEKYNNFFFEREKLGFPSKYKKFLFGWKKLFRRRLLWLGF